MIKATYINHMGDDLTVVNSARVSFGKKCNIMTYADVKLIGYLAKHKHMSPFGHCFATFHVTAPIFVARQLVKHKFLRWNEISRRYVDDDPVLYEPNQWRGRSKDKKQGSDGVVAGVSSSVIKEYNENCFARYNELIAMGVAPEMARMVLPQSTMTEWYWSGSLDAFADMCLLRCAPDTQFETRQVAQEISIMMYELFPRSWYALVKDK